MRKQSVVVALAVVMLLALAGAAQAQSQIRVTAINLTPTPFNIGTTVTIAATIKNTGAAAANPGIAYVDIFKADTWLVADRVFHAEQPVAAMAAGATRTVTFASRPRVPDAATNKFWVRVTVIDAPNEFGEAKTAVYVATCSYSRQPTLLVVPRLSASEINHP